MISYRTIKRESINAGCCRSCLNYLYGLSLVPKDIIYTYYPDECDCCKKVCNIVADIRKSHRYKLIKAHKKYKIYDSE